MGWFGMRNAALAAAAAGAMLAAAAPAEAVMIDFSFSALSTALGTNAPMGDLFKGTIYDIDVSSGSAGFNNAYVLFDRAPAPFLGTTRYTPLSLGASPIAGSDPAGSYLSFARADPATGQQTVSLYGGNGPSYAAFDAPGGPSDSFAGTGPTAYTFNAPAAPGPLAGLGLLPALGAAAGLALTRRRKARTAIA